MSQISENAKIAKTAVIHENVVVEEGVIIHDFVVLYPGTIVKKNAEIYDHCVIGKWPTTPGCTARSLKEEYGGTVIGENSILCPGIVLYAEVYIGKNVLLGDNCSIREGCHVGDFCIISRNVSVNYDTTIGNYTKIMDNSHITGNMTIGNHVFISVQVASTNDNAMGREGYSEEKIRGGVIEDYATIGAAANILPNVTIGKNAMVGAGSVVTKDVGANQVVMGVPARVVRELQVPTQK